MPPRETEQRDGEAAADAAGRDGGAAARWTERDGGSAADAADRDAVERVLAGDRNAFALIVDRHGPALYRFAWRLLKNEAMAEEITQEGLARAYSNLGRFRGDSPVRAWLYRIVGNLCRDALRSAGRRERPYEDPAAGGGEPVGISYREHADEGSVDRHRAIEALDVAIGALPEGQREALTLRLVENLSYEEISVVMGVPVGALKVRVHRARERLKAALGDLLDGIVEEDVA